MFNVHTPCTFKNNQNLTRQKYIFARLDTEQEDIGNSPVFKN